jgi:hypothetical protein
VSKLLARIERSSMSEMDIKRYQNHSVPGNGGLWLLGAAGTELLPLYGATRIHPSTRGYTQSHNQQDMVHQPPVLPYLHHMAQLRYTPGFIKSGQRLFLQKEEDQVGDQPDNKPSRLAMEQNRYPLR